MILLNFKTQNRFAVKNYRAFPVSRHRAESFELCRAATTACDLPHGTCLGHKERFLAIHVQNRFITVLHSWNQSVAGGDSMLSGTGSAIY